MPSSVSIVMPKGEYIKSGFDRERLKRLWREMAIRNPIKISLRLFVLKKERAKKNPKVPEDRACKKVAPKNRRKKKEIVSANKIGSNLYRPRIFSKAAKPRAAIII